MRRFTTSWKRAAFLSSSLAEMSLMEANLQSAAVTTENALRARSASCGLHRYLYRR